MPTKSAKSKTHEAAQEAQNPISEMSEVAFKNWEKAFRSGMKLQEQAGRWWSESMNTMSAAQDWQKRVIQMSSLASEMIPQTQKQIEQAMDFMTQNTRAASEIYNKAVDAAQAPVVPEPSSQWMDFWTSSFRTLRNNAEVLSQMNNQAMTAWMQMMRRNETLSSKAA